MIRSISLDGVEYARVGLLVLPVVELTDEELDSLLADAGLLDRAKAYVESVVGNWVTEADASDQARQERGA